MANKPAPDTHGNGEPNGVDGYLEKLGGTTSTKGPCNVPEHPHTNTNDNSVCKASITVNVHYIIG